MSGLDGLLRSKQAPAILEHTPRRAAGYGFITDPTGVTEVETLQCCHCGGHWNFQKGSGRRRGFCFKCSAVTCGSKTCDTCIPQEKFIEQLEAAARRDANLAQLR